MRDTALPHETLEIGYREDGVFFLTAAVTVPDAAAAERYMGPGWKAVAETHLGPTGQMVNSKDPEWDECTADTPAARRGWKLVDTTAEEIFEGDWYPNPDYRAG